MRSQEPERALERVAPVLTAFPAVGLVVVPVDLVGLVLDLERLDHPLGHERDDPLVLATVEDEQRGLDPLGAIDRRAASIQLRAGGVVGLAHHPFEIQSAGPVTAPVALGDLRVAVQVHARRPHRRLLDQRREDQVAAVRPAVHREPTVRPRLVEGPSAGIDQVVDVGVAPLVVIGMAERAAVAGRTAEIDVEEGEPFTGQQQLERLERAVRLPGRATMRVDDRRHPAAAALARRASRAPQRALDPQAVARRERDPLPDRNPPGRERAGQHRGPRIGDLAGPSAIGRDAGDRQQPQILGPRLALADGGDPRAVGQPADRTPDAVPRGDAVGVGRRLDRARTLRRPATPALRWRAAAAASHDEIDEPVVDLDVDEPAPVG